MSDRCAVTIGFSSQLGGWIAEIAVDEEFALEILKDDDGKYWVVYNDIKGSPKKFPIELLINGIVEARQNLVALDFRGSDPDKLR